MKRTKSSLRTERAVKVELELPEIPGYEYTGEYRPVLTGELYQDKGSIQKAGWDTIGCYPIARPKTKPPIIIYKWLVNYNTSTDNDPVDVGYAILEATEDHIDALCKEYGWTAEKMYVTPTYKFEGDIL